MVGALLGIKLGLVDMGVYGSIEGKSVCRTVGVLLSTVLDSVDGELLGSLEETPGCIVVGASLPLDTTLA